MTADEQYQKNCAFLATRPNMEGMLAQLPQYPMTDIQLMPGTKGHLFGQVWNRDTRQWWAICSPEDPVAEAERDCESLYTREAKVFTLLGMGLGYFATALARRLQPWQRLIIWDVEATMFKAMMHACDITPLFSDKRTDVHIGTDVLAQVEGWWLGLEATDKLHITLPFRASYTNGPCKADYDAIMEKTVEMIRFHHVGLSTWKIFGSCIGDNDLYNIPEYFLNPGYLALTDLWKGRPAVCLAAGPSLQKNLRFLLERDVRDRVAVISVGTVYALVHGLGVDPDVVTTIDFQRLNWTDQFVNVPLDPACPLVYLHSTYPQTPRRWPGPIFVATNASDTTGWLGQFAEEKGSAAQVQTVAHLNVLVALALGANPIILLGQDLSMPIDIHHAAGARAIDVSPGESPEEAFMVVQDYQGKPVHTRHSFMSMRTVFERIIAEHPDRTFLNCSEGGLLLAGAEHLPLQDALARYKEVPACRGELRRRIRDVHKDYKPHISERFQPAWQQLCVSVEELVAFAERLPLMESEADAVTQDTISADAWGAAAAEDCLADAEVVEMLCLQKWNALLDQERIIQERTTALGLIAIRRFEFLELMSQVPPAEDTVATAVAKARYNAARLLVVAQLIREEAPILRQILCEVTRRLSWITEEPDAYSQRIVQRLFARQRYGMGATVLKRGGAHEAGADESRYQQLFMHYLWHTQQYEAAMVLMRIWGFAPEKLAVAERYMATWRATTREAMKAYFPGAQEHSVAHASGEPWAYEY